MSAYLLDTNIIAYLADVESPHHAPVWQRFQTLAEEDEVSLSILTIYELHYSLAKGNARTTDASILRMKEKLCATLPIIPLSPAGAMLFGELKFRYEQVYHFKKPALARDTVDLIIASTALEKGAILVSNDTTIFPRIQAVESRLQLENWALSRDDGRGIQNPGESVLER